MRFTLYFYVLAMIVAENLTKRYGHVTALDELNFHIEKREIFGFIGPNGAGKTTTIRILATLLRPTSGIAYIGGASVITKRDIVKMMVGYMPDTFGIHENISVEQYLEFFALAYKIVERNKRKQTIEAVMELTDLTADRNTLVPSLSRGMQQRLSLARVLIHNPEVLLLDEPASGLDPRARVEMRALLKELRNMGKTILISSHILSEIEDLCTKIGIIQKGKLIFMGTREELLNEAEVRLGKSPGRTLLVKVENHIEDAVKFLKNDAHVKSVVVSNDEMRIELAERIPRQSYISQLLFNNGYLIVSYKEEEVSLENVFISLTKDNFPH